MPSTLQTYQDYISSFQAAVSGANATLSEIGSFEHEVGQICLYATIIGNGPNNVLITSGIHGEEQAAPYGLLEFVKSDIQKYTQNFTFHIIPIINPLGFEKATRFGSSGMDLNRLFDIPEASPEVSIIRNFIHHRTFHLFVDLHEDSDSKSVYLYESGDGVNDDSILQRELGFLDSLSAKGIEISQEPFIYGAISKKGIVYKGYQTPGKSGEQIQGSIADYLLTSKRVSRAVTLETPGHIEFHSRVEIAENFLNFVLAET